MHIIEKFHLRSFFTEVSAQKWKNFCIAFLFRHKNSVVVEASTSAVCVRPNIYMQIYDNGQYNERNFSFFRDFIVARAGENGNKSNDTHVTATK